MMLSMATAPGVVLGVADLTMTRATTDVVEVCWRVGLEARKPSKRTTS